MTPARPDALTDETADRPGGVSGDASDQTRSGGAGSPAAGPVGDGAALLCPFCGERSVAEGTTQCGACGARTDLLSRQATQNEMGPWFVRDETAPFRPGCRLETIERWARSGRLTRDTVIRGPSTHQNWMPAVRVPGVARLFGVCHACEGAVRLEEMICGACGAALHAERDRQHLGLAPVRPLPGRGPAAATAASLLARDTGVGAGPRRSDTDASGIEAVPARGVFDAQGPGRAAAGSREGVLEARLARSRRAGRIAGGLAVVAIAGLVGVLLAVRFGWITSAAGVPRVSEGAPSEPTIPDDPAGAGLAAEGSDARVDRDEDGDGGDAPGAGDLP
jgi:sarcosine oxidase delta subunit